jgi:Glu-tRNA(Gln) amidotransferase subunit E-like FAD-binding protein
VNILDYKEINLKCGLEIHRQLDTKHKLFCDCPTTMLEKDPLSIIKRKQHPVASELGEVDISAQYEFLRDREFNYQIFKNEDCLVECDEEPIHPVNKEALEIVIKIALLFNCTIPEEIQVMRKTVIDGSNTSAFQRTMIVGLNGFLEYMGRKIVITHVSLEEDAAGIVDEENGKITYKLNRLGVPLVEICTGLLTDFSPKDVQDIAYMLGMICRSTGKVKRGIGTVRQDLNVSIRNGERVEIKGLQELNIMSKIIELEVQRQLSLPKVIKETRALNPDGTTRFTRPLPGAARMYPETDIPPVPIDEKMIDRIKKELPELWTEKYNRFKEKLNLSDELTKEILGSEYLDLFEKLIKKYKVSPSVIANLFTNTLKDMKKRENVLVENLSDNDFEEIIDLLDRGKIVKESIPEIIKYKLNHPDSRISDFIKKFETIGISELRKIVKEVIEKNKGAPEGKIIGIVMSQVRGKVKSEDVIKTTKEQLG